MLNIRKVLGDDLYYDLDKSAIARLSRVLELLVSGSDEVFTTPYAKNRDPDDILRGWDNIFRRETDKLNEVLLNVEKDQRLKFGPRSIAVPWKDRRSGVINSFSKPSIINQPAELTDVVPVRGRLRPISLNKAAELLKRTTNSGLPFLQKKGLVLDTALKNFNVLYNSKYPAVPFTRTQENFKTRTVWGVDIATVLNEMRFYRPLLEYQRKLDWRVALRKAGELDSSMTKLIRYALSNDLYLVSIDFKTYDDTVKPDLQDLAFRYIKLLYQNKYDAEISDIQNRFATMSIVTPYGIVTGSHGIPSGSSFTNEVGSVVQYLIAKLSNNNVNFAQVQGDDGVYASSDPEELKAAFKRAGLVVNDDKSYISKDYVIYLQNLYHIDYMKDGKIGGIYPTYRALLRLVFQERFEDFKEYDISGRDYYAIRSLAILENVKNHPLFEEFVKYVMTLDKYSLIPSDRGISQYIKMKEIQDGKDVNFKRNQYDETTGIKDFESYKLIKKLMYNGSAKEA